MKKICLLLIFCAGCGSNSNSPTTQPSGPPSKEVASEWKNNRFLVQTYGKFNAGYENHTREILVIIDTSSKKQYLAITGCGVAELYTTTEATVSVNGDGDLEVNSKTVTKEE